MPLLKDFNQFLTLLLDTLRSFGRGRIWLALFTYFLIMTLALLALYYIFTPVTYPLAKVISSLIGAEVSNRFFHYPGHLLYLPYVYGWLKLALTVLLEGLFLGMAAVVFRRRFLELKPGDGPTFRTLLSSWVIFS